MGKCLKCYELLPPQFLNDNKVCLYCELDKKVIVYGEAPDIKTKKKEDVVKEYKIFLRMVKDKNDILKKAVKGDVKDIPVNILED